MRATNGRVSLLQSYVELLLAAAAASGMDAGTAVGNGHHRAVALQRAMRQLPELLRLVPPAEASAASAAAAGLAPDITRLMVAAGLEPAPVEVAGAQGTTQAQQEMAGQSHQPPPMHPVPAVAAAAAVAAVSVSGGALAAAAVPQPPPQPPASLPAPLEAGAHSTVSCSHQDPDGNLVQADARAKDGGPLDSSRCDRNTGGGGAACGVAATPDVAADLGAGQMLPGPPMPNASADPGVGGPNVEGGDAAAVAVLQHAAPLPQGAPPAQLEQEGSGESLLGADPIFDCTSEQTGELDLDSELLDLINLWQTEPPGVEGVPATPFPVMPLELFDYDGDDDEGMGYLGSFPDAGQPPAPHAAQSSQQDQHRRLQRAAQTLIMAAGNHMSPGVTSSGVDAAAAALNVVCLAASPEMQQSQAPPSASAAPAAPAVALANFAAKPMTNDLLGDGSASRPAPPLSGHTKPDSSTVAAAVPSDPVAVGLSAQQLWAERPQDPDAMRGMADGQPLAGKGAGTGARQPEQCWVGQPSGAPGGATATVPGTASVGLPGGHSGQLPRLASHGNTAASEAHGPDSLTQWLPSSCASGHKAATASGGVITIQRPPHPAHAMAPPQSYGGPGNCWQQQHQQQVSARGALGQAALRSSSSCDAVPMQQLAVLGNNQPHTGPLQVMMHDASYMLRLSSPGYPAATATQAHAGSMTAPGAPESQQERCALGSGAHQAQPQQQQQQTYACEPQQQQHHVAQGAPSPPALLQAYRSASVPEVEERGRGVHPSHLQARGPSMPGVPGTATAQQRPALQQQQQHYQQHAAGTARSSDAHGALDYASLQARHHAASCSGTLPHSGAVAPALMAHRVRSDVVPQPGMPGPSASASGEPMRTTLRGMLRGTSWSGVRQGFASHPASPVMGGCETAGKRPASWLYEDMAGQRLPLDDQADQGTPQLHQRSLHGAAGSSSDAARCLGRAHSALIDAERVSAAVAPPPSRAPARSCDDVGLSSPSNTRLHASKGMAGTQQQGGAGDTGVEQSGRGAQPRIVSIYTASACAAGGGTESWDYGSDASPASNNYCSSASVRPPWDTLGSGAHSAATGRAGGRDSRRRWLEGHNTSALPEAASGPTSGADSHQLMQGVSGTSMQPSGHAPCYRPAHHTFAQRTGPGRLSNCQSAPYEWTGPMDFDGPGPPGCDHHFNRDLHGPGRAHASHDPRAGRQPVHGSAHLGLRSAPQEWHMEPGRGTPELTDAEMDMMAEAGIEQCGRAVKRSCSRTAFCFSDSQSAFAGFDGTHSGSGAADGAATGAAGSGVTQT
ncbi:hypothetical protein HYH02_012143 [Chlamydomonas schloesseri]|uniref:Uncharacterized protein n=1 Tax=Chlamydomonas schloesseri TaxID=2026947 RepID=A0A835SX64_9CHLO|nr:hypothetical protein HYH02_012143 [Chlamydomonas schloesseri]|eukprot:KAG2434947.1 hypothetical protein HYH02_012143 [Chlamydomonas schloesseri]